MGRRSSRSGRFRQSAWALAGLCAGLYAGLCAAARGEALGWSPLPWGLPRQPAPNLLLSVAEPPAQGMERLRQALLQVFSLPTLPEGSLRLGFQSAGECLARSSASEGAAPACAPLQLRRWQPDTAAAWAVRFQALQPQTEAPVHALMEEAGRFMQTQGAAGPYARDPGRQAEPVLGCRTSHHLLLLGQDPSLPAGGDGAAVGAPPQANSDGQDRRLPDGRAYAPWGADAGAQRLYADAVEPPFPAGVAGTLPDLAFEHWSRDLQPALEDRVPPRPGAPGAVAPAGADSGLADPYWHPVNDPARWQHLSSHVLAFEQSAELPRRAAGEAARPWWDGQAWGGDLGALRRAEIGWCAPWRGASGPQPACAGSPAAQRQALWHLALNGRGRLLTPGPREDLAAALAEWLQRLLQESALAGPALERVTQRALAGGLALEAGFRTQPWRGFVRVHALDAEGVAAPRPLWDSTAWPAGSGAGLLWSHDGRSGIEFDWDALAPRQQAALAGVAAAFELDAQARAEGQALWRYLRGDARLALAQGGPWRNRVAALGPVVHSAPLLLSAPRPGLGGAGHAAHVRARQSRPALLYVAANEGRLRVLDALDGHEWLTYVPAGAMAGLRAQADPADGFAFGPDGPLLSGDFEDGRGWRSLVLGSPGRGGRGYFALDATDPRDWARQPPAQGVLLDTTERADPDLGHLLFPFADTDPDQAQSPQITRLHDGRWAVLLGNGVDSASEQAVLLIQYLDGARELRKLRTDGQGGQGNGLSHPRVVDLDGDGLADLAYAGDQLGQLWKFDLTAREPERWGSAPHGRPLMVARDAQGRRQPISVPPAWMAHPQGGLMLLFGSGRALSRADEAEAGPQSLYAVRDAASVRLLPGGPVIGPTPVLAPGWREARPSPLVAQRIEALRDLAGRSFLTLSPTPVRYAAPDGAAAVAGWYLDLPPGEGLLTPPRLWQRLFWASSTRPARALAADEAGCEPGVWPAQSHEFLLDVFTAEPPPPSLWGLAPEVAEGVAGLAAWRHAGSPLAWRQKRGGEWQAWAGPAAGDGAALPRLRPQAAGARAARLGWRRLR